MPGPCYRHASREYRVMLKPRNMTNVKKNGHHQPYKLVGIGYLISLNERSEPHQDVLDKVTEKSYGRNINWVYKVPCVIAMSLPLCVLAFAAVHRVQNYWWKKHWTLL